MNSNVMRVIFRPLIVRSAAAIALAAAGSGPCLAQTTYHVALCGDDTWSGASPVCAAPDGPKRTIQAAIDVSMNGDTVLVADGVYTGAGNRNMNYGGRAITVRSAGGASACTIDCQASHLSPQRAFHFRSGETNSSVLDGFTISNGWMPDIGGAVLCQGSAPLIENCTFIRNGTVRGGAIYVSDAPAEFRLIRCTFRDNTTTAVGGALYILFSPASLTDCTFSGSIALNGGAVFSAGPERHTYKDCTFTGNITTDPTGGGGGAITSQAAEPPSTDRGTEVLTNCTFIDNRAGRIGGGVWFSRQIDATVTGCTFIGNYAPVRASGLGVSYGSRGVITNCLFASNTGEASVGALWIGNGVGGPSSATVANCTFVANGNIADSGLYVSQTSTLAAANCIYWDNVNPILAEPGTTVSISFSDIQGGWSGMGSDNIDLDPRFVNAAAGDYRLAPFSLCIDAGLNTAVPVGIDLDLDSLPRMVDDPWMPNHSAPPVDMGAYEFQGNSCSADFNNNGVLNSQDFFDFLGAFFDELPSADFNHDSLINSQDYFDFLAAFFAECA